MSRLLPAALSLLLPAVSGACAHHSAAPASAAAPTEPDCAADDLDARFRSAPSAQVIVLLHEREGAPERQARLLQELGPEFELARSYQQLPGFAGTITRKGYELARAHRDVRCIQLDHPGSGG